MAKVYLPLSSERAAGSVASTTYQRQGKSTMAKTRVGPATQYSAAQITIRKVTKYAARQWANLTDAQRYEWGAYAVTHQPTDRDFGPHGWAGYNAFIRCNVGIGRYTYVGDPLSGDVSYTILADPPTLPEPLPPGNFTCTQDLEGIHPTCDAVDPPPAGTPVVEVWASGLHSTGRNIPLSLCRYYSYMPIQDPLMLYVPADLGRYTFYARTIQLDTGQVSLFRKAVIDFNQ